MAATNTSSSKSIDPLADLDFDPYTIPLPTVHGKGRPGGSGNPVLACPFSEAHRENPCTEFSQEFERRKVKYQDS
jgi:hypothetical protein